MSTATESGDVAECSVCAQAIAPHMLAWCDACSKPYHLNQRNDLPGDDCGEVWISEEHLGLQFACNNCLHPAPEPEPGGLDDILDTAEAAEFAGVSESEMVAAATAGIRHRKTSSGTYLFERADLLEFRQGRK
ncbi:MAG: hypothetical protein ACRDG3_12835 [Tepidiformaceae bacterium]